MKNPDWNREEIILALDLYFNLDYGQMHGRNHQVAQLSRELRDMHIHKNIPDRDSFRSVNSVALKLNNLKKLDKNFNGKGMADGGQLEKDIWQEFYRHRDKLKKEAAMIRLLYTDHKQLNRKSLSSTSDLDLMYRIHKNRESNPLMCHKKFNGWLEVHDSLICEICLFDPSLFYGEVGKDNIEIHYQKELHSDNIDEPTVIKDFILVCANCHAVLDGKYGLINADDIKKMIAKP